MNRSRREFFKSFARPFEAAHENSRRLSPFPPGFIWDAKSLEMCAKCEGFCVTACPEDIIKRTSSTRPRLDVSKRGCTFCDKCNEACPHGVFSPPPVSYIHAEVKISSQTCLAWNSTICNSCSDVCDPKAVVFSGMRNPKINANLCNGCGQCISKCPTDAISFHEVEMPA